MPEIRCKHIWKYALNDPYQNASYGHESWPMAIIGRIIFWLVKNPKEGGIGVQCVGCITIVVGFVNAHAVLVNGQRPDDQV